jgi:N-hydroxyarylamine O-acetyltransferase
MDVAAYLHRINYRGSLAPNAETLRGLHRAHLLAIPYENLDIHLGCTLTLDEAQIFHKIVIERRGGWCFEMNGLLAWALRELGFKVTLLAGAVNRPMIGDNAERNHLILLVALDRPYLADVGFGNGFLEPLPLEEGAYDQGFLSYQLFQDGERWQFRNHAYGGPGFDFTLEPHVLPDFAARCHELQTSPESGFVRATVCHRFNADGIVSLRSATLRRITQCGVTERVIRTQKAYQQALESDFDLHFPDVTPLWEKAWQQHLDWVRSRVQ